MSNLFTDSASDRVRLLAPLAERMRPRSLDEIVGQQHLVGPEGPLRRQLDSGHVPNAVLVGPPGSGKTTLARLLAARADMHLEELSAVACGLADVRRVVAEARERLGAHGRQTVLFLDEIHRFNKAQQDALLPAVEAGVIRLIGATTENPYVSINRALLSRLVVYTLKQSTIDELRIVLRTALGDGERGLAADRTRSLSAEAEEEIALRAAGDARVALTLLETAAMLTPDEEIDVDAVRLASDRRPMSYDRAGDYHYDTISAYIKSMRRGDADGAMLYLATMLEGGEDPMFVARRLAVFASEDVGMADPQALLLASAAMHATEKIGMPEARIPLAHVTRYCALAAKDRTAYEKLGESIEQVRTKGAPRIPDDLTNSAKTGRGRDHLG